MTARSRSKSAVQNKKGFIEYENRWDVGGGPQAQVHHINGVS